jgi:cytochrome P450
MDTDAPRAPHFPTAERPGLDPDPLLAELRERAPVARVQYPYGEECWLVTRYDDVKAVLTDTRFSRAATIGADVPRNSPVNLQSQSGSIAAMDPPDHVRLRKLVSPAFTVRAAERLRPRTEEIAASLLDDLVAAGPPAELVESYALPLPIAVISELLGVPFADRERFRAWADAFMTTSSPSGDKIRDAHANITAYLRDRIAHQRQDPSDDLLGTLIAVHDEGDRLDENELVNLAFTVLVGGFETTASQIAKGIYCLLLHPEQLDALRDDPQLVPGAVEEVLRFISLGPGGGLPWIARDDVELGGVTIHAGEPVVAAPGAANRDEAVFADADSFDIRRAENLHVAFGHGAHYCLGANLARMEMQVALGALVARFPGLRLAPGADAARWRVGTAIWGLEQLLVDF